MSGEVAAGEGCVCCGGTPAFAMTGEALCCTHIVPGARLVTLLQGVWCDGGRHRIPRGGTYLVLADGRLSCLEHRNEPAREVSLAGAHE